MASGKTSRARPRITIGQAEHESLTRLAESLASRNAAVSDALLEELDRARILPDARLPEDVVRMGSTLRYVAQGDEPRTVTLVYPAEADIGAGRISVLTPVGAALIGLSPGQSIDWMTRDGRRHRLTVESVEPFRPAGQRPEAGLRVAEGNPDGRTGPAAERDDPGPAAA